jgi:hypothetical protein
LGHAYWVCAQQGGRKWNIEELLVRVETCVLGTHAVRGIIKNNVALYSDTWDMHTGYAHGREEKGK